MKFLKRIYNRVILNYLKFRFGYIRGINVHIVGNGVNIEKNVVIGDFVSLICGTNGKIEIKSGTSIGRDAWIAAGDGDIVIGEECLFGPRITIVSQNHATQPMTVENYLPWERDSQSLTTIIGKRCHLGANVTILPGTILGDYCVVGANSTLSGVFESGSLIAGVPGRIINKNIVIEGLDKKFNGIPPFIHTSIRFF